MPRAAFLLVAFIAACWIDPVTPQATTMPEFYANNVKGYAETVAGLPPETALATDFRVIGNVAHWRECTAVQVCGTLERERPAAEVLAVEHVRHAGAEDAGEPEVVRLSLAARPKYTVPMTRTR